MIVCLTAVGVGWAIGASHPRYFGYYDKAVTLYPHVSDRIGVFAAQVISCARREATYVLDGLLDNDTSLDPQLHTTDKHGFTETLWGLCHLLGIDFMPRLKDLADQRLWLAEGSVVPDRLANLFTGSIDLAVIVEQWDHLVRIAASLKARTAPAHVILQRLTAGRSLSTRLIFQGRRMKVCIPISGFPTYKMGA